MAENEEKKEGEKEKKEGEAADPNAKMSKKNKMILFGGIGGGVFLIILIGAFAFFKIQSAKRVAELEMSQNGGGPTEVSHGKPDEKKDDHGKKDEKKDDHGKKDDKKDDHGKKDEKKDDKKDEKKDEKKDDKKDEKKDEKKDDKKEPPKGTNNFGDTFTIPKMDLNLGNPIENRYIRLAVGIEYRGGETQAAELKQRDVQIKDIIISTVTGKTRTQLLTESGKELLRREILNKINEVADQPVQNVFFTEFLVE
jgi:flagellar basal body-associated protein FliL